MKYSLVSREVIADSIETVAGGEGFDGLVAIGGCDKNMPGCLDGHGAAEPPGGVRLRRHHPARLLARQEPSTSSPCSRPSASTPPARSSDDELADLEQHACPGAGSCGGMYTANTMASAIEALGMSLPNSSAQAADLRRQEATTAVAPARRCAQLIDDGITPRDIMTRKAFENAITVVIALGGSTNAVLHLLAIAHAAGVKLDARRLHAHRQARAGAGRPQAERQVRHGRPRRDRRHCRR